MDFTKTENMGMKYVKIGCCCIFMVLSQLIWGQVYFEEDFEQVDDWSRVVLEEADSNKLWLFDNPANRAVPFEEGSFAIFDSDYFGVSSLPEDAVLVSPIVSVEDADAALVLEFEHQFRAWEESYGTVELKIAEEWVEVYNTGMSNIGYSSNADENTVVLERIDLSGYGLDLSNVQFRFRYRGDWDYWWAVDKVRLLDADYWDIALTNVAMSQLPACLEDDLTIGIELVYNGVNTLASPFEIYLSWEVDGELVYEENAILDLAYVPEQMDTLLINPAIDFSQGTNWTFTYHISGDANSSNDTVSLSFAIPGNLELPTLVIFDDYNGNNLNLVASNWTESTPKPFSNEESFWESADWFANIEGHPNGNAAKVNLNGSTNKAWLTSPQFLCESDTKLTFDLALTQANALIGDKLDVDDTLKVGVLSSCLEADFTFFKLYTKNSVVSSTGQKVNVPLGSFAGEEIRVAFFVTDGNGEGTKNLDLFIDNIQIAAPFANDLALSTTQAYFDNVCLMNSESLFLDIVNLGIDTIDFAEMSAEILVNVGETIFMESLEDGILAPADTLRYSIEAMLNDSIYEGGASVALQWDIDENVTNNELLIAYEWIAPQTLPSNVVNFQTFDGSNLSNIYGGWKEGRGNDFGQYQDAAWTASDFGNDADSGMGKAAKIVYGNVALNDWIQTSLYTIEEQSALFFDWQMSDVIKEDTVLLEEGEQFLVLASVDCFETADTLWNIDANYSESGGEAGILLGQYEGENVQLLFFAKSDSVNQEKALFVDNIQLKNLLSYDIAIDEILNPQDLSCFGSEETMSFSIQNTAFETLDFAEDNLIFDIELSGTDEQSFSFVLDEGTLAFGETLEINLSETLDLSLRGFYFLSVEAMWELDENENNNDLEILLNHQNLNFTIADGLDMDDYNGTNLSEEYPNWSEASGLDHPIVFDESDWDNDFFGNNPIDSNFNSLRINLWQNKKAEWLLGPLLNVTDSARLTFDLALCQFGTTEPAQLGSDDRFEVMISQDCGQTYFSIYTYDANSEISNVGQSDTIDLSPYVGPDFLLAFYATEGEIDDPEDVELFLDNIKVENLQFPPGDVGVLDLFSAGQLCESQFADLILQVQNYSPYSISNFVVTSILTGAVNDTLIDTIDYDIEAFDDGFIYHQLNTIGGGTIELISYTNLPDDGNPGNDTLFRNIEILADPQIDLGEDTSACGSLLLSADIVGAYTNLLWSTADSSEQIAVLETGDYILTAFNENCDASDTINVTINGLPMASFNATTEELLLNLENNSMNAQTYIWDFGDGTGSDEQTPLPHTYASEGMYEITLIAIDSICGADTTTRLVMAMDSTTSLNELLNLTLNLYPNPTSDYVYFSEAQTGSLQLYNLQGKLVDEMSLQNTQKLNLKHLRSGLYICRLVDRDGGEMVGRLVVE